MSDEGTIAEYLRTAPRDRLAAILEAEAAVNTAVAQKLLAAAAMDSGGSIDVGEWKKRITKAFGRGFVDYRHAPDWAHDVMGAIDFVDEMATNGHFTEAATLAEHAHKRLETAVNRVDDSAGWITMLFNRVGEIHARCCNAGAFPPKKLAQRLVKLELNAELDTFHRSAITHSKGLGPDGLDEYLRLVDQQMAKLPPIDHGTTDWTSRRLAMRVQAALEAHAIATNNADRLIAAKNLSLWHPDDYVELAELYHRINQIDDALQCVDDGLANCADNTLRLPGLRAKRAELLKLVGRANEVDPMFWAVFVQRPNPNTYREFVGHADGDHTTASKRATDHVVGLLPTDPGRVREVGGDDPSIEATQAVAVLIAAEQYDQAWQVACRHGASHSDWMTLAEQREAAHPADVLDVYANEVERHIKRQVRGYKQAAKWLKRIGKLATEAGQPERHLAILESVKQRHGRKPSLMKLL